MCITDPFADLREVTVRKELQVRLKASIMDSLPVSLLVKRSPKGDVVADSSILYPSALRAIRDRALEPHRPSCASHLANHAF